MLLDLVERLDDVFVTCRHVTSHGIATGLNPLAKVMEAPGFADAYGAEPGIDWFEYCLKGMDLWSEVTDRVLVTTKYNYAQAWVHLFPLYGALTKYSPPGMTIHGGLAPTNLPGWSDSNFLAGYDLCDQKAWRNIADAAYRVTVETGTRTFTLEMERALKPFHDGEQAIDLRSFQRGLSAILS